MHNPCPSFVPVPVSIYSFSQLSPVTSNSQNMEFTDEIPVEYTQEPFEAAFNPQYIIDVLKNVQTEKVSFAFVNASQPVLIEPVEGNTFKYVIMPMRA